MDNCSVLRELIRSHVESQSDKKKHIPIDDRIYHIGINSLDQEEKRKIIAAALVSDDFSCYELMFELDDQKSTVNKLIYECIIGKSLTKEGAIDKILDSIFIEKSDQIQEMFEEEWEKFYFETIESWSFYTIDSEIKDQWERSRAI